MVIMITWYRDYLSLHTSKFVNTRMLHQPMHVSLVERISVQAGYALNYFPESSLELVQLLDLS